MTIRQLMESRLFEHALWEDEAKTIVEETEKKVESMKGRRGDGTIKFQIIQRR